MIDTEKEIVTIESNKEMTKFIAELKEDVKLTVGNLREKALMCSSIWAKWLSYLYHEKELAEKIATLKAEQIKNKLQHGTGIQDSVLRMKIEDKLVQNDETLQKLNKLAKTTQDNIDYIERALNILSGLSFNIKNVSEIIKLNMSH